MRSEDYKRQNPRNVIFLPIKCAYSRIITSKKEYKEFLKRIKKDIKEGRVIKI